MDLGFRNRVAIVTGSSQGIGKAKAQSLSEEGAKTVICSRNEDRLGETARDIENSTGNQVLPIKADLRDRKDIETLVKTTKEKLGRIDILINNTGGPPSLLFLEAKEEDWQDSVNMLLLSVTRSCRMVVPYMRENKWGRIINMTSFAAKQPADRLVLLL